MTDRTVATLVTATPQPGTGILHPFPSDALAHIDPFVFLDTGAPLMLGDKDIYIGPHPHRGVQPVSLLFRGRIDHRDSLGTRKTILSGGMQWLVAGAGALHEEVLQGDEHGIFHMAQLWVNVPASIKMSPPEHHAIPSEEVPIINSPGDNATIRLFAGSLSDTTGPAPLPTPVLIAHIALGEGGAVSVPIPSGWSAAFCVVQGEAEMENYPGLGPGVNPVFNDDGDTISMSSIQGCEVLLMSGKPIGEPIVAGGGFVMNTNEELATAFDDYKSGRFGLLIPTRGEG